MIAQQAIEKSITQNKIVYLDMMTYATIELAMEALDYLNLESDDSVCIDGTTEYWGTQNGHHWRVHWC